MRINYKHLYYSKFLQLNQQSLSLYGISGAYCIKNKFVIPVLWSFTDYFLCCRCLECRLRTCRTAARSTHLPRRFRCRPTGGDHQGAGHPHSWANTWDEPQLHWVQVSANQVAPLAKGMLIPLSHSRVSCSQEKVSCS